MRLSGRLSAAIEVLDDIFARHNSAAAALHEWGRAHRFAGSGDRSAIGNLVYDALRQKSTLAARMGADTSRALVLAVAGTVWGLEVEEIAEAAAEKFGPGPLSDDEKTALKTPIEGKQHYWVDGNFPQWIGPAFKNCFGDEAAAQGNALSRRAPVDLRVNTLKTSRKDLLAEFAKHGAIEGPLSPNCVRIPPPHGQNRSPNVEIEAAHGKGWFEVQDAASQIVSLLAGAEPGHTVVDLCAGAGGKTLAMAASMNGQGSIYAWDRDKRRLRPIFERIARAGVENVEVIPADQPQMLEDLAGKADVVFLDAPCSGTGSWRRKPDAKWRFRNSTLDQRIKDQQEVLESGAKLVKPGGKLVYVTCSVLPQENTDQITAFLSQRKEFSLVPYPEVWKRTIGTEPPLSADGKKATLLLTPATHDTDGFFIAIMERG
ncbi:MAG TPA: RsmB/NOP family class I SAM-dependent RNA methyltransferase [Rhizobiales bacterium]|nr:RsmB/NOP family class I SAM-dependent RNA methyltransferase [Hyphomicrobiales bacterium]